MPTKPAGRQSRPGRPGILAAAVDLFAQQGVSGTSLQQIADAAGVTKAAVYHHFPAKEDLLRAALEPAISSVEAIVRTAGTHKDAAARTDAAIIGMADQAVRHRHLWSVLLADSTVSDMLLTDPDLDRLFSQLHALLAGPRPTNSTRVRTASFLTGLVGPLVDPRCRDLSDETIRAGIVESGRRLLGS